MGVLAEGKIVRLVELYKWRELPLRLDVWPFAILYVAWVTGVATSLDATDAGIVLAALVVLHILTFLFSAWSVNFRCFVQATKVKIAFFLSHTLLVGPRFLCSPALGNESAKFLRST
jgi:cation-transporting ATPase 13A1